MNAINRLLEEYYERRKPLGIAFVQDGSTLFGFGRPCNFVLPTLGSTEGLSEIENERWDAVVFVSTFRLGKHLVVQFPRGSEAIEGPPGSFVRLAAAVQSALENPSSASAPPPTDGVAVRPRQPRHSPPQSDAEEER